jgi:2-polyprenyl-3-methyl-5-hydroxy-6-metoxy-1,4-benzoquinol methylase
MNQITCDNPMIYESNVQVRWEEVNCNLCGRDDTEVYHRERLGYFDTMLDFTIVRCRHCGLVYTNPRLVDHNAAYLYASSEDVGAIEAHAQAKRPIFERALKEILHWQQQRGRSTLGTLLDIGCGHGHFLHWARQQGFSVTGIEPAEIPARYAREIFQIPVRQDEVLRTELAPENVDVITMWDVIEHVSDPYRVLQHCSRWLKPGGIMALRFPSSTWQKIKGVVFASTSRPTFGATIHLYFFNGQTFTQMARKVDLDVAHIRTTGAEANTNNSILDRVKKASYLAMRAIETISGKSLGNLEVYCQKIETKE